MKSITEVNEARKLFESGMAEMVKACPSLLAPLKELGRDQIDAVVTLWYLSDLTNLAKRPQFKLDRAVLLEFSEVVNEICPPIGSDLIAADPCFDATVSYLSALKDCDEEGKREEECSDAWGPAGQSLACAMEKIENAKNEIGRLLTRQIPPRPIPWEIDDPPR